MNNPHHSQLPCSTRLSTSVALAALLAWVLQALWELPSWVPKLAAVELDPPLHTAILQGSSHTACRQCIQDKLHSKYHTSLLESVQMAVESETGSKSVVPESKSMVTESKSAVTESKQAVTESKSA